MEGLSKLVLNAFRPQKLFLLRYIFVFSFWINNCICINGNVKVVSWFLQELIDVEGDGIADMVFHCIQEMDIDNRMMVTNLNQLLVLLLLLYNLNTWRNYVWLYVLQLYQHIVLSGGSTMYPGLPSR